MQSGLLLETTFGEDKTTITGAGDRTSGPVLRSGEPRLAIQEAWAWLTATQLVRASAVASLNSQVLPPSLFEHPAAELSVDDSAQLCEDRRQPGHIA
jgi:hypothetical protein